MNIKYQIFISSTYEDLKEERHQIVQSILKHDHFPIGMENFGADDDDQWEVIKRNIDLSDIYVLIIGHRYGSISKDKISFTEKEFNYALNRKQDGKIKILVFIRDRDVKIEFKNFEKSEASKLKLEEFIERIKTSNITVDFWNYKDKLVEVFSPAISKAVKSLDAGQEKKSGWIRLDSVANKIFEAAQIEKLKENMYAEARRYEIVNSDIEKYDFDSSGSCVITRDRIQLCNCDVMHSYTQYISDLDNPKSHVLQIINTETGFDLPYLIYKREGKCFAFFTMFPKQIKKGETIRYQCRTFVQNYLSNLFNENNGTINYQPFPLTVFKSKKDIYTFDNIKKFKNLTVSLNILGKTIDIPFTIINNKKVFVVDFPKRAWKNETIIKFKLNN